MCTTYARLFQMVNGLFLALRVILFRDAECELLLVISSAIKHKNHYHHHTLTLQWSRVDYSNYL